MAVAESPPPKEPLVLLHGITMSGRAWDRTIPFLAPHHRVLAPTLMGHRGGAPPVERPLKVSHLVDDIERILDREGLDRPHLAGNSLGGWIALELAGRGRACSVCAISPAGFWKIGTRPQVDPPKRLERVIREARRAHRLLPVVARSKLGRRRALRSAAGHGENLTPDEVIQTATDLLECVAAEDMFTNTGRFEDLDPPPPRVTIAWAEKDRILPLETNGAIARRRMPSARFIVLPGVGHVPMIDDPRLVARTILATTGAGEPDGADRAPAREAIFVGGLKTE
jgi:pimeloyl-ACP methyl ester carboxylesterase